MRQGAGAAPAGAGFSAAADGLTQTTYDSTTATSISPLTFNGTENVWIWQPPVWSDSSIAAPRIGQIYSDSVAATVPNSTVTYSILSGGTIPGLVSVSLTSGAITWDLSGVSAGDPYNFTIRATSTYGKLRAGGHNTPTQEVLRTDTPKPTPITGDIEAQVVAKIHELAPKMNAILLGDQAVSTITEKVLAAIVECAKKYNLVTVADSRARAEHTIFNGVAYAREAFEFG